MKKWAYYNEHDKSAAAWIRELMKSGHIMQGEVDERSIEDVLPSDVSGFVRCHWFAGIAVWDYALRRAGWPDDRPVWTGSCPCQPFSSAGKGVGFDDERHLWPAFHHLIKQRKPPVVFGEQVASKAADDWIDLVHADLEAVGYAFGCIPFPSAGVGAPHIRDRTYWVADADGNGSLDGINNPTGWRSSAASECVGTGRLGNNNNSRLEGLGDGHQAEGGRDGAVGSVAEAGELGGMGDACRAASKRDARSLLGTEAQEHGERVTVDGSVPVGFEHASESMVARPGPTNGFWRDADWLFCRDGKWRPVEPGAFPLVAGVTKGMVPSSRIGMEIDANKTGEARVMRLRGYGNAINAEAAKAFIESYLEMR